MIRNAPHLLPSLKRLNSGFASSTLVSMATVAAISIASMGTPIFSPTSAAQTTTSSIVTSPQTDSRAVGTTTSQINNAACVATSDKPHPVVLLHGTTDNATAMQPLAASLAQEGYCVWTPTYGQRAITLSQIKPGAGAIAPVMDSAHEVSGIIDRILADTGASKVDLVGHSQGGLIAKTYIERLGGAANVGRVVALAGSIRGTTVSGLSPVSNFFSRIFPRLSAFFLSPASLDQIDGSAFLREMNALPDTRAGIAYTALYLKDDETITPFTNSMFRLPSGELASGNSSGASHRGASGVSAGIDVTNIDVAIACPAAPQVRHATMPQATPVHSLVKWSLNRSAGEQAPTPNMHCAG